jgi:hypothetical protein
MIVQQSVEYELTREPEVLIENTPQSHVFHYKSKITWPGIEPIPP